MSLLQPTSSITQNLRLPGQYSDAESGLYHNGFRDYLPGLGRYVESDPIGLMGGINTYAYANANPQTNIDASGKDIIVTVTDFVHYTVGVINSLGKYGQSYRSTN